METQQDKDTPIYNDESEPSALERIADALDELTREFVSECPEKNIGIKQALIGISQAAFILSGSDHAGIIEGGFKHIGEKIDKLNRNIGDLCISIEAMDDKSKPAKKTKTKTKKGR